MGQGRRIWRSWPLRMLRVAPGARLGLGPPGAKNQLRQTAETVDFLFERVHSVWNYRNSCSFMIGRRSAHSERTPPYARQANLIHCPLGTAADRTVPRNVSTCRLQANVASTPRIVCSSQARPLTSTCKRHSPSWRAIFKKWRQSANGPSRPIRVERRPGQKHWLSLYFLENDNLWRG